jgi:hypothetical protein
MKSLSLTLALIVSFAYTAFAQDPSSDARAAVEAAGGTFIETAVGSGEWTLGFHIHGREVKDADLANIAKVNGVVEINLGGTGVGDAGLEHLAGMVGLKKLYLQKTKVTSAGFAPLVNLDSLVYLNLYDTAVDDAVVVHLLKLDSLERVFLWGTKVTEAAAGKLRAGREALYVNTGFEKIQPPSLPVGAASKDVRYIRIDLPGEGKILSLAEVEVFSSDENIATAGTATQSSVGSAGSAERANDGNTSGVYEENTVTHTATEANPWWELDLGAVKSVDRIVLYNRNTAMDRINGAVVRGLGEDRSEQFSTVVASVSTIGLALVTNTELPVAAVAAPVVDTAAVLAAQAPYYPQAICILSGEALTAEAPGVEFVAGGRLFKTCCTNCQAKVEADVATYAAKLDEALIAAQLASYPLETCTITGKALTADSPHVVVGGTRLVRACCGNCVKSITEDPTPHLEKLDAALIAQQAADYPLDACPISGQGVASKGDPVDVLYGNTLVRLCCNGCVAGYEKDPAKYAAMVREARGL